MCEDREWMRQRCRYSGPLCIFEQPLTRYKKKLRIPYILYLWNYYMMLPSEQSGHEILSDAFLTIVFSLKPWRLQYLKTFLTPRLCFPTHYSTLYGCTLSLERC